MDTKIEDTMICHLYDAYYNAAAADTRQHREL